jgi:hypothetical protein
LVLAEVIHPLIGRQHDGALSARVASPVAAPLGESLFPIQALTMLLKALLSWPEGEAR